MITDDLTTAQIFQADERLTEVFRHVYCIRQREEAPVLHRQLVPNYEMMLVFNFGPAVTASLGDRSFVIEQTAVLGPLAKALHYEVPPGADLMVVMFTLNGFYRLVGKPIHELRWADSDADAGSTPMSRLGNAVFHDLWEELKAIASMEDRVAFLTAYTLLRIAPPDEDAHSMLAGVLLFTNPAVDPVKAIAETRQLSPRSVQLRFQTNLGFSAKELARFLRFKNVVAGLVERHPTPPDWADLVFVHGYHDQSHLIRDFQQFMGVSPTEFVQQLASQAVCITQPGKHY